MTIRRTIIVGTIIGKSTKNQDQLIIPHNFKTIRAIVNNPKNPIPE